MTPAAQPGERRSLLAQEPEGGPGGVDEDRRPQQGRQEGPQHQEAADRPGDRQRQARRASARAFAGVNRVLVHRVTARGRSFARFAASGTARARQARRLASAAPPPVCVPIAACSRGGNRAMPRFAANLSMMFTEVPFLDRFARARAAGFAGRRVPLPLRAPGRGDRAPAARQRPVAGAVQRAAGRLGGGRARDAPRCPAGAASSGRGSSAAWNTRAPSPARCCTSWRGWRRPACRATGCWRPTP